MVYNTGSSIAHPLKMSNQGFEATFQKMLYLCIVKTVLHSYYIFMTDQEILDTNIITLLGLDHASDEQKASVISALATLVQKQVTLRILEILSQEEIAELEKRITEFGDSSPEVLEFIRTRVSDMDGIAQQELISVKRQVMGKMMEVEAQQDAQ